MAAAGRPAAGAAAGGRRGAGLAPARAVALAPTGMINSCPIRSTCADGRALTATMASTVVLWRRARGKRVRPSATFGRICAGARGGAPHGGAPGWLMRDRVRPTEEGEAARPDCGLHGAGRRHVDKRTGRRLEWSGNGLRQRDQQRDEKERRDYAIAHLLRPGKGI